jgi:hypothetical protein
VRFPTPVQGVAEQRRRTAPVWRLLHLLRAHKLRAKIPRAHRYRLTTKGEALMSAAIDARDKVFPKELQEVAEPPRKTCAQRAKDTEEDSTLTGKKTSSGCSLTPPAALWAATVWKNLA